MSNTTTSDNLTLDQKDIDKMWSNINNSSSDRVSHWILIASLVFATFGTISNFMSVIVLRRLSTQLSTFVYLTGLSLSDMITCTSIMMTQMIDLAIRTHLSTRVTMILRHVDIVFGGLAAGSRALSLWISTAVTMDRWILICYPVYGKTFCTLHRAKVISGALFVVAFVYSIPLFFEYEVVLMPSVYQMINLHDESFSLLEEDKNQNSMLVTKGYSDLAKRRLYRWAYMFFNGVFVYTIPTVTIVFFNLQLIRALHRVKSRAKRLKKHVVNGSNHNRRSHHSFQSKYSVTIIVIVIVLTLLICRSPTIVLWALWSFEQTIKTFFDSSSSSFARRFHSIANLIALINAATNFLPFCVFGQLFRTECLNIYCCRKITNEQLLQPTTKKCDESPQGPSSNRRARPTDNFEQSPIHKTDNARRILAIHSETTSSANHSTSAYSSTNMSKLCESPFAFRGHSQPYSKIPSSATPLLKETTDL